VDQKKIIQTQILSFLNADFENLDPSTPMEWLKLYNQFYPQNDISEDDYYELFSKNRILEHLNELKLDVTTGTTDSGQLILTLEDHELVLNYFSFIQERFKSSLFKELRPYKMARKNTYPTTAPVTTESLGKKVVKNNFYFNIKNKTSGRNLYESWDEKPKNFEILIWRSYYSLVTENSESLDKLKCCKVCSKFFIGFKEDNIICKSKTCKNKRREQKRRLNEDLS